MKKLNSKGIKVLKIFHIFFAFSWVISAIVLCLLIFAVHPLSGDEFYMHSRIVQIVDDYFIIPGAIGALITGLIYSIWTNWGFFKHPWITVKWVLIIVQILLGTFMLSDIVNNNVILADQLRDAALTNPAVLDNILPSKIWGSIQTFFLLFVVVISVIKPWKKKVKMSA